jgi:hypothetical protein
MQDRKYVYSKTNKESSITFKIEKEIFGSIIIPIEVAVEKYIIGIFDSGWYVQFPGKLDMDLCKLRIGTKKGLNRHNPNYFFIVIPSENVS